MTYRLAMARSASRALHMDLPEAVASAVVEFVTGVLLENPQRVGKPLQPPLDGRVECASRAVPDHLHDRHRRPGRDRAAHLPPARRLPVTTGPSVSPSAHSRPTRSLLRHTDSSERTRPNGAQLAADGRGRRHWVLVNASPVRATLASGDLGPRVVG